MIRRVHVLRLIAGSIALPAAEAHHVRDVLRLDAGSPLELFDDTGNVATGVIRHVSSANVVVDVETVTVFMPFGKSVIVAAAVPKGDRADWMVEKLTELGVMRFIPLIAEHSVVLPAGKNKIQRWERIAIESAKQSRRGGVMEIAPLTLLDAIISAGTGIYLSTTTDAIPLSRLVGAVGDEVVTLLIGPEGGWSDSEISRMQAAGLAGAKLTSTILRVETAAVIAAGMVLCHSHFSGVP